MNLNFYNINNFIKHEIKENYKMRELDLQLFLVEMSHIEIGDSIHLKLTAEKFFTLIWSHR